MADRYTRSAELLAKLAGAAPESKYIRAYHGSPSDFDQFDFSKIGTGEGNQAFTYGGYFAGAEDVGEYYRRMLAGPPDVFIGGEPVSAGGPLSARTPREHALWILHDAAAKHQEPMEALREAVRFASDTYGSKGSYMPAEPIIDSLMRFKSDGVQFGPRKGKVYEVEIGHPESSLLDLDARVTDQQPQVLEALRSLGLGQTKRPGPPLTGYEAYNTLASRMQHRAAEEALATDAPVPGMKHFERMVSSQLRDAGVPGAMYFDGTSRRIKDGTRNYVAFPGTEDSIRILRKFGLLAPVAAEGMSDGR